MVGVIGGNLGSLTDLGATFDRSAAGSEETAALARRLAMEMERGLDEVSELLRSRFAAAAEEYGGLARDTQARLDATAWTGSRRERAIAAGEELTATIRSINASQEARVETFRVAVVQLAADLVADMEASYGSALHRAQEAFSAMQRNATQMRDGLEQIDAAGL